MGRAIESSIELMGLSTRDEYNGHGILSGRTTSTVASLGPALTAAVLLYVGISSRVYDLVKNIVYMV